MRAYCGILWSFFLQRVFPSAIECGRNPLTCSLVVAVICLPLTIRSIDFLFFFLQLGPRNQYDFMPTVTILIFRASTRACRVAAAARWACYRPDPVPALRRPPRPAFTTTTTHTERWWWRAEVRLFLVLDEPCDCSSVLFVSAGRNVVNVERKVSLRFFLTF